MQNKKQTVVIIAITSDIGKVLAKCYFAHGYRVIGTYRTKPESNTLVNLSGCELFYCDIADKKSITSFQKVVKRKFANWDTFISCVGEPRPLKSFFQSNFEEWRQSLDINAIEQLRMLHGLYDIRNKETTCNVIFFSAGGVDLPVANFSAYTVSKILLSKMCEYVDFENNDINIFSVNPGWTKTKIHNLILASVDRSTQKYKQTLEFLHHKKSTKIEHIFDFIQMLTKLGKKVSSGRSFLIRTDFAYLLTKKSSQLLIDDPNIFKLRRYTKNIFEV